MLGLLLTIAAVALAGLTVYARLWRRGALSGGRPVGVRWHRRLGVPAAVVALALSLSGTFHLAVKSWQGDPTAPALALVLTAGLGVARHFSRWRRKTG
ncbi:MAG: hypothetical protein WBC62_02840 [Candidatus Macondimonas sp.]